MKKLILMTSALTLVAGAASASITLSASASLTYGNWDGAAVAAFAQSTALTGAFEDSTASGVSYGAKLTIEDLNTVTQGILWVSASGLKFSFGTDAFGALEDGAGDDSGDVELTYATGAITAALTAEANLGLASVNAWNLAMGYAAGNWTLGLNTDASGLTAVSVATEFSGYKVGGTVDTNSAWDVWASKAFGSINAKGTYDSLGVAGIALDGAVGDMTWALGYDTTTTTTAALGYAMGAVSLGMAYDSSNAGGVGDDALVVVTMGYAAGDNLDFGLKVNDQAEYELSIKASFDF